VSSQVETLLGRYIVYHLERSLRSPVFLDRLRQSLATRAATTTKLAPVDEGPEAAAGGSDR
jgi:hypothetical protein